MFLSQFSQPKRQSGVATILIVLLLGLAVSITVAASIYALRSNQQQELTTHSLTAAQAAAWRGVETVRQYLLGVPLTKFQEWTTNPPTYPQPITGLSDLGIPDQSARITNIQAKSTSEFLVTAQITAFAGNAESGTKTSSTLEVVYDIAPQVAGGSSGGATTNSGSGGSAANGVCMGRPSSQFVAHGDINKGGGQMNFLNDSGSNYADIAVDGNINITGSQAAISGCATGNISLNAGGIKQNGHLYSNGAITIQSMSPPSGTTLWGKSVSIDSSANGALFNQLKAGGYQAEVRNGVTNELIGHASVGGQLIPATVNSKTTLPWDNGVVIPISQQTEVTLTDGSVHVLDLSNSSVKIDPSTGIVSNTDKVDSVVTNASDTQPLQMPTALKFIATGFDGGDIRFENIGRTNLVWGNTVEAGVSNQSINIADAKVNGEFQVGRGSVDNLIGGADLLAATGNGNKTVWYTGYWGFPKISSGNIAGSIYYSSARTLLTPGDQNRSDVNMQIGINQPDISPGLPGLPFCDTRVAPIDATNFKSIANYVFEFKGSVPYLTIHNVKTSSGVLLDKSYNLTTDDIAFLPKVNGRPFISCNQNPDNFGNGRCSDLKNATPSTGWKLDYIYTFPPGIMYFDGTVTINNKNNPLIDMIISTQSVNLGNSSQEPNLIAPNFATVAQVCSGDFWPTNLCDKSGSEPTFVKWQDSDGKTHQGYPLTNFAILAQNNANVMGWTINGNILLGGSVSTGGGVVTVNGSVTSAGNQSPTSVGGAGLVIKRPNNDDQNYTITQCGPNSSHIDIPSNPTPPRTGNVTVQWSRYL